MNMDEAFPLLLPAEAAAIVLPWDDDDVKTGGGIEDRGWLVEAATRGEASATWCFGKSTFGRHLCLHRFQLWWIKPSHGIFGLDVPPETSLILAERHPSKTCKTYVALLPLSDTHARSCLHRLGEGNADNDPSELALSADTGDAATPLPERLGIMLVATGSEPFRLVRKLVLEATRRLREQLGYGAEAPVATDKSATVPGFVESFGWCTWDSFYTMVSPEGIEDELTTLHQGGVRPRWVIIDDGWQSTTNDDALNTEQWDERLVALEANKRFRRFDREGELVLDLGDTTRKMKGEFGVDKVLAWHAMSGYWAGVDPEARGMAHFEPRRAQLFAPEGIREVDPEMQPELDQKRFGMVPAKRVESFFLAYHKYLKDNGVDGVKVDVQSMLDCMGEGNGGAPAVTRAYHEGLARSVQTTFKEGDEPPALIHCMCHASLVLFHIACVSRDRAVIRGSGDFYPEEDASHGPHLYTNAFNAILLSNLGLQDWDMFQTGLGGRSADKSSPGGGDTEASREAEATRLNASWFHAAARAVSGGPVYVSDQPGQHNGDILAKLVLEDGSVLRAFTNALPTLDCLMRDPQADGGGLLQIWAINKLPGTGVVGNFNVRGSCFSVKDNKWVHLEEGTVPAVKGTVAPADVHAFDIVKTTPEEFDGETSADDGDYVLYLHCRKEVRVVGPREAVEIEVLPLRYELATFCRIQELGSPQPGSEPLLWAPIGLADMFNSSAAVTKQKIKPPLGVSKDNVARQDHPHHQKRGATVGVELSIRGSGKFLGLASRRPIRAALEFGEDAGSDKSYEHEFSFSILPETRGRRGMGVVEVDIPGPWGGREQRLVFDWA